MKQFKKVVWYAAATWLAIVFGGVAWMAFKYMVIDPWPDSMPVVIVVVTIATIAVVLAPRPPWMG